MKYLKTYENNNIKIKYEFYRHKNNDEIPFVLNKELYNYDNYDLDSMINAYIKVKGDDRNISIKKIIVEDVDITNSPQYLEYQIKKDAKKYNI